MWPFHKNKSNRAETNKKSSDLDLEEITLRLSGSLPGKIPTTYDLQRIHNYLGEINAWLLFESRPFNSEPRTLIYRLDGVNIIAQPGKHLNLIGGRTAVYDIAQKLVDYLGMSEKDATAYTKPLLNQK